ncbi:MAG: hypothetical protein ACKV2V_11490 [Blastocatellia bacterium]
MKKTLPILIALFTLTITIFAQEEKAGAPPIQVGNAFPNITTIAEYDNPTEAGIGALLPWANRLWFVSYVAHMRGAGTGLFWVDENMRMHKHPASVVGTFTNRYIHTQSNQACLGPHVIDTKGNVRTIESIKGHRLTSTMDHLTDPANKVYMLAMEGEFFEVDVRTLETKQLFNLVRELGITFKQGKEHFKSAHTAQGRVVVANNSYYEADYLGEQEAGRLAEWDGKTWTILEKKPFVEVAGKSLSGGGIGNPIFATGWDRASAILKVFAAGKWSTWRLPKGAQTFDHAYNTEWMRIRDAQTERFLMDLHGIFYELPAQIYGGRILPIRPISTHLRIVPDFCYWRGMFVMGGDQTDRSLGQPQTGLWFGQIDDLWKMGKPAGWGSVWDKQNVKAGEVSDPFLMTGFDRKVVHLQHRAARPVTFRLEVDFLGDGTWAPYDNLTVPAHGYRHHEFPAGFSAHWVRVTASANCNATVTLIYN